jgi:hypothetical protein
MAGLFYGLLARFDEAGSDIKALEGVLIRNIYGGTANAGAAPLAAYVAAETERLADQPVAAIMAGRIETGEAA